ncbi:MAG: phosphopantetheine-binding protein [Bacteroidales bacterium]
MVDINEFIASVEEEFEEMPKGALTTESNLREHFTWDSINALIFIAHVNVNYNVEITAEDLINSITVGELYNIIKSKADSSSPSTVTVTS